MGRCRPSEDVCLAHSLPLATERACAENCPHDNCRTDGRLVPFFDEFDHTTAMLRCVERRCVDCGTWLPLGPANDGDERVRVEIAAAELASWSNNADEPVLAWVGRRHFIEGHEMPTTATALAGWLAAAIATHPNRDEGDL